MTGFTIIGCIILAFLGYFYLFKRKPKGKVAPGPPGFPIIGSVFRIDMKNPSLSFTKFAEEYGDFYKLTFGNKVGFVLSDPEWVKEIFSKDAAFAGRMNPSDVIDMFPNGLDGKFHGIINSEGEHWQELRRFTLRQLRDLGFGKSTMENYIMDELQKVIDWMKMNEGKSLPNMKDKLTIAVVNSLLVIIAGHRYKHDDPILQKIKNLNKEFSNMAESGALCMIFPISKYILPETSGYLPLRRVIEDLKTIFTTTVKDHEQTYSDDYQRDFIDCFLKEIRECKDIDSAFFGQMGAKQLIAVISDLFQAGTETTSSTLDWMFLYLSTFPDVQKKLQAEIDAVVGKSRPVGLGDRPNLPYCEAFIAEHMRHCTLVGFGVPHRALADREFKGYHIPKGSFIMSAIHRIHHHPKIWGDDVNDFRPERMLDANGNFKKPEALMPFSIGRRQCAGETLARDTLFLYLCNIFHRFEVQFDPNDPQANPGLEPRPSLIIQAKPYKIIFKDRLM